MGATSTVPTSFGQKLRAQLDGRGMGVRTLARTMAATEGVPARTESIRRQLKRYLSDIDPVRPTTTRRREIEAALGLAEGSLKAEDDDDEADPAMREAFHLFVDLMTRIQKSNEPSGSREEASLGSLT